MTAIAQYSSMVVTQAGPTLSEPVSVNVNVHSIDIREIEIVERRDAGVSEYYYRVIE